MSRIGTLIEFGEFIRWRWKTRKKTTPMDDIETHGIRAGAALAAKLTLIFGAAVSLGVALYLARLI